LPLLSSQIKIKVGEQMSDQLVIAGRAFKSRLIVGTGKYRSFQEMARAHAASGADMVTVAVRRVNLTDKSKESLLDYIDEYRGMLLRRRSYSHRASGARSRIVSLGEARSDRRPADFVSGY
jgi:thiazole synthase ThiGH ThiG subunit